MASNRAVLLYLSLIVAVVIVGVVDGKRGGGGSRSSSRSSRSRTSYGGGYSSSRSSGSYSRKPLSGRIVTGSSSYTRFTWREAAVLGLIYGGTRYTTRYPHRHEMPPICTNNYEKSPEGRVYGYFICPRDNESLTYVYCCGPEKREYCCDKAMAEEYFSQHQADSGLPVGAIIGIMTTFGFIIVVAIICCKHRQQITSKFSKKGSRKVSTDSSNQQTPLNDQVPPPAGYEPGVPPPSYDSISPSKTGFGAGADGLPYGRPPTCDDKNSGLPPPDIDGAPVHWASYPPGGDGLPYPYPSTPYPPSGDTPYPPSDSAPYQSMAPYPPPGNAPYPTTDSAPYPTTDSAHYPTPGNAPYPTTDGAPYPPPGNAPYPTTDGAPYPPPGNASYPTTDGSPYPTGTPQTVAPYPVVPSAPSAGDYGK